MTGRKIWVVAGFVLLLGIILFQQQKLGKITLSVNEAPARVTPPDASPLDAYQNQLTGRCFGGEYGTARAILQWAEPNVSLQKRTNNGPWVSIFSGGKKLFFIDRDIAYGNTYAYRVGRARKGFSNRASIRPTKASCASARVISMQNVTNPQHTNPAYVGETIKITAAGEPGRPVELCYTFSPGTTTAQAATKCDLAPRTAMFDRVDGVWTMSYQLTAEKVGAWTQWVKVGNRTSNRISYLVAPQLVPQNLAATDGLIPCSAESSPIELSWTNPFPAGDNVKFSVKRADVAGGPYTTIAEDLASTVYEDTPSSGTYYYVVSAKVGTTESPNSNEASATMAQRNCDTVMTVSFNGPGAGTVKPDEQRNAYMNVVISATTNIEIRKSLLGVQIDGDGDGAWDTIVNEEWKQDLLDIRAVRTDTGAVILGPVDGVALTGSASFNSALSFSKILNDVITLEAGQTLPVSIEAKITRNGTNPHIPIGAKIRVVLGDYSDAGTSLVRFTDGTPLDPATIVPNAPIFGATMTLEEVSP